MKILDVYPKEVHAQLELSIKELKMLRDFVENVVPIYGKVVEDYPESSFIEHHFLPAVKDVVEQMDKFSK